MKKIIYNFEELIKDLRSYRTYPIYHFDDCRVSRPKHKAQIVVFYEIGFTKSKEAYRVYGIFTNNNSFIGKKPKVLVLTFKDFPLTRIL